MNHQGVDAGKQFNLLAKNASVEDFIRDYFESPILQRTGYNAINTLAYAAIALAVLYLAWRFMKKRKFDFAGSGFLLAASWFVLFGSTARVLTDLSDAGRTAQAANAGGWPGAIYAAIHSWGIFDYGYLTVTPGIYLVTAALFLCALALGKAMKNDRFAFYAGMALWLPCLALLLPFMANFWFAAIALAIACAGSLVAFAAIQNWGEMKLGLHQKLAIFGQALDGAATFTVIDLFSKTTGQGYFEQHVLSAGIGQATPLGFGAFFLVKLALSSLIVYLLSKEKMDGRDRALVLIVVAIMGFAPGIRDLLRMLCGT